MRTKVNFLKLISLFALGFNRHFWSRCQNSRAVDQNGDKRSSAAAGIRTNTQPSATSRCVMLLLRWFPPAACSHVRFYCARLSSRAAALPRPQPAGHQVRGRCHRRGRRKSRRVYSTRSPGHSHWRIQEVKTKTDCTRQSEHLLLRQRHKLKSNTCRTCLCELQLGCTVSTEGSQLATMWTSSLHTRRRAKKLD